ncbi:putative hydrogenase-4 component C [uncultured delta proteobacterium]|uniref:Putative hydrogenase-4 component C n=1 Tax=uncultured delta proteobacterium TaxID=34034 RepID=A0A212KHJ9_9DELT|nr:putative hydrogenase-4 component C [uncultured delta proteobacterium]
MSAAHYFLGILLAPLLLGVINRVKAKFAGRRGRPYLQLYYDLAKLLQKSVVYPVASSAIFWIGPLVNLGAVLTALLFVPLGGTPALVSFTGDFFLAAYVLAMGRFAMILAALDTGSAFEGMGASREAVYSALAEPVLLAAFIPLGMTVKIFSLSAMLAPFTPEGWERYWPVLILLGGAFFIVLLTENCRIPVDDPATHLELTMIHEVMILDHGGVDLALIEFASALKLWFFCAVVAGTAMPDITLFAAGIPVLGDILTGPFVALVFSLLGIFMVAVLVGIAESSMARLKLLKIPALLTLAGALTALACLFSLR